MFDRFDSRALQRNDCYAQRFMRAGTYAYNVVPGHGQALSTDYPFIVHVEGESQEMTQHNLRVNAERKGFVVDQPKVAIRIGDMVLWNGGNGAQPYAIVGEAAFFSSYRMVNECGYSHAFGTAGDYEWADAFGSKIGGKIQVRDPDCSASDGLEKWHRQLAEGNVVMIADGQADRTSFDILTGQTVFFAIVKGEGISITDRRWLEPVYRHDCGNADKVGRPQTA
jgi:hypothetical protein